MDESHRNVVPVDGRTPFSVLSINGNVGAPARPARNLPQGEETLITSHAEFEAGAIDCDGLSFERRLERMPPAAVDGSTPATGVIFGLERDSVCAMRDPLIRFRRLRPIVGARDEREALGLTIANGHLARIPPLTEHHGAWIVAGPVARILADHVASVIAAAPEPDAPARQAVAGATVALAAACAAEL